VGHEIERSRCPRARRTRKHRRHETPGPRAESNGDRGVDLREDARRWPTAEARADRGTRDTEELVVERRTEVGPAVARPRRAIPVLDEGLTVAVDQAGGADRGALGAARAGDAEQHRVNRRARGGGDRGPGEPFHCSVRATVPLDEPTAMQNSTTDTTRR